MDTSNDRTNARNYPNLGDSRDDPRSVYEEPVYNRNQPMPYSFDRSPSFSPVNGHHDHSSDNNRRLSTVSSSSSLQRGPLYAVDMNGYQMTAPAPDGHPPYFINTEQSNSQSQNENRNQYNPFDRLLPHQVREVNQFPVSMEQVPMYVPEEVQYLRLEIPVWQRPHHTEPLHYQTQYDHSSDEHQLSHSTDQREISVDHCGSSSTDTTINLFTKSGTVDRWNDGYNREIRKTNSAECDWTGTPTSTSQAEKISVATSWESINSAFSRDPGIEFSPSTDSFASNNSDCMDTEWKPFGGFFACTPPKGTEAKIMTGGAFADGSDLIGSESDDQIASAIDLSHGKRCEEVERTVTAA